MEEKILNTKSIYEGRVVKLNVCEVQLPDGKRGQREIIQHVGASAIVAIDDQKRVLLVRQYRSAAGQVMSELPAGILNANETPEACAIRELQEETGYKPGKIESLGGLYPSPGYTTEFIHLFLATELVEARLPADADEMIEVDNVPLLEALNLIDTGVITDSKTIIGLLRYARKMQV